MFKKISRIHHAYKVQEYLDEHRLSEEDSLKFDFEDKYEKQIEKMESRIEKALDAIGGTAEGTVIAYKKALELAIKLRDFCYAGGLGGQKYYNESSAYTVEQIECDFRAYMEDEYEEDRAYEIEATEYLKKYEDIENRVFYIILSQEEVLQIDLYPQFDVEDKNLVINAIKHLVQSGKITKARKGNTNLLKALE